MPGTATPAAEAVVPKRSRPSSEELGGEVQDRLHDGLGAALAVRGAARLVQQGAVPGDEGGLHPGAAHIEGDDVRDDVFHGFHGRQSGVLGGERSSPLGVIVEAPYKIGARCGRAAKVV
ncbi:hypothetical protein GCM10020254_47240 [Streptomyces goshikiensis]